MGASSEIKNVFKPYFRPQTSGRLLLQSCYIVFLPFNNYGNDCNLLKSTGSSPEEEFCTGESAQQIEQAIPVAARSPHFKRGLGVWNLTLHW